HEHAVRVGVVDGGLAEAGVVDRAQGLLHDTDTVVDGVDHGLGEVVDVGDEGGADAQRGEHAVGALGGALLDLGRRVTGLTRAVAVVDVVGRVVVVLVEVPAGDVVHVAV